MLSAASTRTPECAVTLLPDRTRRRSPRFAPLLWARICSTSRVISKNGLLDWGGVEHAMWDAIGKIAGQPVYKLLGGAKNSVKVYLTTVWQGKEDQSDVTYDEQAQMALKEKKAGFKGMKIRAWRPNPLDDAEACRVIRPAVGPDFAIMFDRTAHAPQSVGQKVWDYETGLKVARALEKNGAYWLEEPYARDDYESHARLCRQVDMLITGGEGYRGIEPYHKALLARAYDIVQPDGAGAGGIFLCRKVAMLAEAYHVPCVLHGAMGLRLAGWLQAPLRSARSGRSWYSFDRLSCRKRCGARDCRC